MKPPSDEARSAPAAAPPPEADPDEAALRAVRDKAARMARARARPPQLWRHLAQVGVLGWLFMLPVIGLSALGHLLHQNTGQRRYAIAGVLLGLAIGVYVVFINVRRSLREAGEQERKDKQEQGQ